MGIFKNFPAYPIFREGVLSPWQILAFSRATNDIQIFLGRESGQTEAITFHVQ